MDKRLSELRDFTQARRFKEYRSNEPSKSFHFDGDESEYCSRLFAERCRDEVPIVLPDERIAFSRSRCELSHADNPPKPTDDSKSSIYADTIHNVCPDYSILINEGLRGKIAAKPLLQLVSRYATEAERVGNNEIAALLRNVPENPPRSFHEALQALRIVSSAFYLADSYQCGFGRFDQYMWPLYKADIENGRLTRDEARELLAEFFISLNRDSDLYHGALQGDNGQSMMLGGCDPKTGESAVNDLTYLVLETVRETKLIDPKINLRIDRNTPIDLLELGSSLTKCALGFPQYSNDEVVIPGLVAKGYALEDARDYSVAACWEFIIPGKGLDIVNIGAVSFPYAVDSALRGEVASGSFSEEGFRKRIVAEIKDEVETNLRLNKSRMLPSPFVEIFFPDVKYRKWGIHGAGSANAADQMAAVFKVFESDGFDGLKRLVAAEDANFEGFEDLHKRLIDEMPKVGNDDHFADRELKFFYDAFADACPEDVRPGTGTAQFYVWLTDTRRGDFPCNCKVVGATADGRKRDAPISSSLAPSQEAKVNGILSVFKSFSGIDYNRIVNGGPLTMELSHSVFSTPEGEKKLAQLIRYFVKLGLQQLQINVLDVAELEDALAHPERHRNLIVRVWGWSGYFCELAPQFQMQIINRHRYGL